MVNTHSYTSVVNNRNLTDGRQTPQQVDSTTGY